MNATPLDQFLVFDAEARFHASLCNGEAETREIINQFDCPEGLQVLRVTMGYPVRDVTEEFISDDIEDAPVGPSPDSLLRQYHERVL